MIVPDHLFRLLFTSKRLSLVILVIALQPISSCRKEPITPLDSDLKIVTVATDARPVAKTNSQKVYVHYMATYEDPTTSGDGKWGIHWTMATQNPDLISPSGKRQIASYFYPLIGPYASSDPDVIDYHLLLMKYAGIDGVFVDWAGAHKVYDYALINRNTDSIFSRVPKAGLEFAICYDPSLAIVQNIALIDRVTAAQEDLDYLKSNYFKYSHYITIDDHPLLLCFSPRELTTPLEWQRAFSKLTTKPRFISLEYAGDVVGTANNGEFAWVDPGGLNDLQQFYQKRAPLFETTFTGAYPGFKDFYSLGGWGSTLFVIDHNGTSVLQASLDLSRDNGSPYLQLITWNDFNEGTMLEPTVEFDFSFLETIQQYTGVSYTKAELQLIYRWYTLRKKYKGNNDIQQKLKQAYTSFVSLDVANATGILSAIQ